MGAAAMIEKTVKVTSKGQTTLPLAIRQLLGVPQGGHLVVRSTGHQVTLEMVEAEQDDPAIESFLQLLANDISTGAHIGDMPTELLDAVRRIADEEDIDLEAAIEGDVCL